jgi:hypothetical protein
MKTLTGMLTSVFLFALGADVGGLASEPDQAMRAWTFDTESPDVLPKGFVIGTLFDGRPAGEWKVLSTDRAKSAPQVLAQLIGKGAEQAYKLVLVEGLTPINVDVQVSFLPISGNADMGGGVLWRAADDRNYYLTKANPLEQNIRIYRVINGVRHLLQNFDQIIDVKRWHTLRVINQGCRVRVLFDEKEVFDLCDQTFSRGRIGLWTKSDALTYFDDLQMQVLP